MLDEIDEWWRANQLKGRTSILFAYALGKSQRILSGVDSSIGPIVVHGAVKRFVDIYRDSGVHLPPVLYGEEAPKGAVNGRALVVAPPSAANSSWLRRFGDISTAFASGWMQVRGIRRRRAADRGFALSDHADWDGLLGTIRETGASTVAVTHGYVPELVRYLQEQGLNSYPLATRFTGESDEEQPETTGESEDVQDISDTIDSSYSATARDGTRSPTADALGPSEAGAS
jgi:putative mRNA 3-end processing factor